MAISPGVGGELHQAIKAKGARGTRNEPVSVGIIPEAQSRSFEHVPNLGPTERPVSNEGRGDAAVAKTRGSAGGGRQGRWLLGDAGRVFNPDAVFGQLPNSDLRRE